MNRMQELLEKARAGLGPDAQLRLVEAEQRSQDARRRRAEGGRLAHTRPPDPIRELRVAVRAFRRAAASLRQVHGGTRLAVASELLGEAAEQWRRARKTGRTRAPRPPRGVRRVRVPRADPTQRLLFCEP